MFVVYALHVECMQCLLTVHCTLSVCRVFVDRASHVECMHSVCCICIACRVDRMLGLDKIGLFFCFGIKCFWQFLHNRQKMPEIMLLSSQKAKIGPRVSNIQGHKRLAGLLPMPLL